MALVGEMNYLTIDGDIYEEADAVAREMTLTATYTPATYDLAIEFASPANTDNEEF